MRRVLIALMLALIAAGCSSGSKPKFVPVSGQVTLDGKPLPNVRVTFMPVGSDNPGPSSVGDTDANGRFTLKVASQQFQGDGAVPGKHKVAVGTILPGEGSRPTDPSLGSADGEAPKGKEVFPEKWNQNTELTFDVPDKGTDKADIVLKWK